MPVKTNVADLITTICIATLKVKHLIGNSC